MERTYKYRALIIWEFAERVEGSHNPSHSDRNTDTNKKKQKEKKRKENHHHP